MDLSPAISHKLLLAKVVGLVINSECDGLHTEQTVAVAVRHRQDPAWVCGAQHLCCAIAATCSGRLMLANQAAGKSHFAITVAQHCTRVADICHPEAVATH